MKKVIIIFFLFFINIYAQKDTVLSDVYKWKEPSGNKIQLLKGNTTDLKDFIVSASILKSEESLKEKSENESLIIIKDGKLKISIKNDEKILGPGSIAYIMPDDEYLLENSEEKDAVFYQFLYEPKPDYKNEKNISNSFMIDWNEINFNPHDRGGVRQYFDKSTHLLKRFEMHVTTLNAGIKSHEPHTHRAEEIVLMIDGNAEMQIDDEFKKASSGDLIFLGANVPHAIKNIDNKPITYFAFQWE